MGRTVLSKTFPRPFEPMYCFFRKSRPSGHTTKGSNLSKLLSNNRCHFTFTPAILAISTLIFCGCGGEIGKTPPPLSLTITVTCPNGTFQTAATTDEAKIACPSAKLLSIIPSDGASTVSPDAFTGVLVETDSTLDPASLTSMNIKLMVGSNTTIAGTVSATIDGKGFMFVPTAKLQYGQIYDNFTATVLDSFGKVFSVKSSFATVAG